MIYLIFLILNFLVMYLLYFLFLGSLYLCHEGRGLTGFFIKKEDLI